MVLIRTSVLVAGFVVLALASDSAFSQQQPLGGPTGGTGGVGIGFGGTPGLQQTGQINSSASIQRNTSSFLNATPGGFLNNQGSGGNGGQAGASLLGSVATGAAFGAGFGGGFGGAGGFGAFGGGAGGFGRGGFGNQGFQTQNQGQGTTQQLRIPMRLGFTATGRAPRVVSTVFQSRLTKIPGLESVAPGVAVSVVGRTAVLEGIVSTQQQRDLIATLALLEPGISDVQNDLQVSQPASSSRVP